MSNLNAIITTTARAQMASARAGTGTVSAIVGMAFGDGGVSGGSVITPAASQTTLNHELLRKAYTSRTFVDSMTVRYSCTLTTSELAGDDISEIGLYDGNGDLVCIKNFAAKGKDSDTELTFVIDDIY